MKFETVGFHPVDGCALNVVEQINQTWTYTVALAATKQLWTYIRMRAASDLRPAPVLHRHARRTPLP